MLQFSKSEYEQLLNILSLGSSQKYSELEAVFKPRRNNQPFTRTDFENIFKRLKSLGLREKEEDEQLDIRVVSEDKRDSNIRITVNSVGCIQEYCNKNDINLIENQKMIRYIKKHRYSVKDESSHKRNYIRPLQFNNYNFRVNLNHEQNCREKEITEIKKDFFKKNKIFRIKKRYSFTSQDKLFRFDLTIVKTSDKNEKTGQYIYARDMQSSGILDNTDFYEFEMEFIGFNSLKKITNQKDKIETLLNSMVYNTGIILQVLRNTYHIISNTEERKILIEYCNLISGNRIHNDEIYNKSNFIGPKNVSLEKMNIGEIDEDFTGFNIRKDYCVTEKADGERHLCFVSKNGKVYLINNRLQIIYTGTNVDNYRNSILDGELITKTKNGNTIFRYLIFDMYFIQGSDIRDRQLNRTDYDIQQKIKMSRLESLETFLQNAKLLDINQHHIDEESEEGELEEDIQSSQISFSWKKKDFYYGDIGTVGEKIFAESKILIDKIDSGGFNYETDGLIYTPVKLPVGGYLEGVSVENTGVTWNACFKWKPPHENTIDFLVSILKEKNNEGNYVDKINYKINTNELGENKLIKYKTLILKTGYNPTKNEKINPCVLINEGKEYIERKKEYISKEFIPQNPSDVNSYLANIYLETDSKGQERMLCYKTGDEIQDDTIVEMSYDKDQPEGFRWKPRNVRYDKTMEKKLGYTQFGNDFNTAQSIWSSYHSPITQENITTGNNIEIEEYDSDIYYSRIVERGKSFTKPLLDFHNLFVKSKLIETVSEMTGIHSSMLDLACGKAGDLHKWINAKLGFILGIDISRDNIENSKDGACVRYYDTKKKYGRMEKADEVPEIIFSAGDTSKNIQNGDCTSDPMYKKLLQVLFEDKEIDKGKISEGMMDLWGKASKQFDICSIQFALHYYFKNIETLRGVLENISKNTKVGGYFIGTCFDGQSVFDKLKDLKKGEYIEGNIGKNRVWKIKKDYEENKFTDDISSVGLPIWVYMETINQMFKEYLVNFNLLTKLMAEYGFELAEDKVFEEYGIQSTGLFSDLFDDMVKSGKKYRSADQMTSQEKEISFMNRYFIFKKISNQKLLNHNGTEKTKKIRKKKKIVVKND